MKKLILMMAFVASIFATNTFAAAPPVTYVWTAPTTGSPVARYTVELRTDGGAWVEVSSNTTNPTYTFSNFDYLRVYEVRVAGIDALSRKGPYSPISDPYMPDLGIPGSPSKPTVVVIP